MKHFFILGSNPALSLAEITAIFKTEQKHEPVFSFLKAGVLIMENAEAFDEQQLICRLGGTIKIGKLVGEARRRTEEILELIAADYKKGVGKYHFGFSNYVRGFNVKPLAMEYKKHLKERGVSARWVTSKEPILSSVVVEQNDLVDDGAEFNLFEQDGKILVGRTLAVQPFKELSFRDYGRPARDDHSGMLPPKLAQIMINLSASSEGATILDPFCGSGTVLTEAALSGFKNLIGSDLSAKAVEDTKRNLEWIKKNYQLQILDCKLLNKSATDLSKFIEPSSVDAVVTEPYLGPQRGQIDIRAVVKELETLYSKSLAEFKKVLKPDGRIVMIWPVFKSKQAGNIMLNSRIADGLKIVPPLPSDLDIQYKLTNRQTIIYGRPGQKVWREIVILEK